jgi:protein-disulfide isomerase
MLIQENKRIQFKGGLIMRKIAVIVLSLLIVPLLMSGCTDKKTMEKLNQLEQNQKSILAKLDTIEKQTKLAKAPAANTRPQIDWNKVHNIPIGSSFVKGNKDAKVTIVEFSDFQCPYCSRLQPTLKQVLEAYPNDVKLVYKDYPLSFHKNARPAAKAARAAGEQGKFWEMHDLIFANFSTLSEDKFIQFARQLGLDMEKFKADFKSSKYDALIQQDIALGRKVGVTGTPTLFMNGKRMQRRSFDFFKESIEGYLKTG